MAALATAGHTVMIKSGAAEQTNTHKVWAWKISHKGDSEKWNLLIRSFSLFSWQSVHHQCRFQVFTHWNNCDTLCHCPWWVNKLLECRQRFIIMKWNKIKKERVSNPEGKICAQLQSLLILHWVKYTWSKVFTHEILVNWRWIVKYSSKHDSSHAAELDKDFLPVTAWLIRYSSWDAKLY